MRIFKTKQFAKWAKKEKLSDETLCRAVFEMNQGLLDAKLGPYIYKKRVALQGRGKRGSLRTILAFKVDDKAFFIFGFAKNKVENISKEELGQLKILASTLMRFNSRELQVALKENEIIEVKYHE